MRNLIIGVASLSIVCCFGRPAMAWHHAEGNSSSWSAQGSRGTASGGDGSWSASGYRGGSASGGDGSWSGTGYRGGTIMPQVVQTFDPLNLFLRSEEHTSELQSPY